VTADAGEVIDVVPYDPDWPARFRRLRAIYLRSLQDVPVAAIEHVGSTAVPGLAAKPVIDIDVVVTREHVTAASSALVALAFEPLGELGIADRWAFRAPGDLPRTNTYVIVEGSLPLRNHLGVREVLRSDATLREAYGAHKLALADESPDMASYVEGKTAVLQTILARAGLSEQELAHIEQANIRSNADR